MWHALLGEQGDLRRLGALESRAKAWISLPISEQGNLPGLHREDVRFTR